jgi:hypothetical protein
VIAATLAGLVVATATRRDPTDVFPADASKAEEWIAYLTAADRAVAARDVAGARRHWRAAYVSALRTQRWEPMVAAGDAAMRISRASGSVNGLDAAARQCYLGALFRARDQESVDGVLRVAEALAQLGDTEGARGAVRLADRLVQRGRPSPQRLFEERVMPSG